MVNAADKYKDLKGYLDDDGKFERMPGKRQKRKQALMFEYLAEKFELSKKYSETEVNEILNQHHTFNDPASLRRFMFGSSLLGRTLDGRFYWLIPKDKQK